MRASLYLPQPLLQGYTPQATPVLRLGPRSGEAVVISPQQVQVLMQSEFRAFWQVYLAFAQPLLAEATREPQGRAAKRLQVGCLHSSSSRTLDAS